MRTITTTLFKYSELSEDAQQKAIESYRNKYGVDTSHIYDEAQNTVEAFNNIFGTTEGARSWLDHSTGNIEDRILELKGFRLQKYLYNNYFNQIYRGKYYGKLVKTNPDGTPIQVNKEHPAGVRHVKRYSRVLMDNTCILTGVYYDNEMLDPIYKFMESGHNTDSFEYLTFEMLLNDCFDALKKALEKEEESLHSDESIAETIESNDYEFTEDGQIQ